MPLKPWQQFEKQVADLFQLKGYRTISDSIVAGRQHDLILSTDDEAIQPILVECKYHEPRSGGTVSVRELEDFAARVLRTRTSGDISAGYLVTNTDFTAQARGALVGRPEEKFVLLRSFIELRRNLVNFEGYLVALRESYEAENLKAEYEPLEATVARPTSSSRRSRKDIVQVLTSFVAAPNPALLVLTGDYGTGKTTVLRHVAYELSCQLLSSSGNRIPVFIPLKWYSQTGGAIALLQRFLDENGLRRTTVDALLSMHAAGQLVIFLDGFDEMLRRSTKQTRRESIQDLVELCVPKSKVILTGRSGHFADDFELREPFRSVGVTGVRDRIRRLSEGVVGFHDPGWRWYEIAPLKPEQLTSFLYRKAPGQTRAAREGHAQAVVQTINSTYNLSDLAKRPILLDMIAQTVASTQGNQVATPAELYRMYVDTWLRIDADKGAFRSLISPEQRLSFSIALAWLLQENGNQEIHWKALQQIVGKYFELEEMDDVDHFASDVRTCTFLRRDDEGSYSFAHLSFQEYFCARFLVDGEPGLRNLLDDVLEEPAITLDELSRRSSATLDFVGDLIGCPVNPSFWRYVSWQLREHPNRISMGDSKADDDESLDTMLDMAHGDSPAFELSDMAEAYRSVYRTLREIVLRKSTAHPEEPWLQDLSSALNRGRLSRGELAPSEKYWWSRNEP